MPILVQPMPMKAGRLITKIVIDGDNEVVSKVNVNLRTRPFAIYPNDGSRESSIRIPVDPINTPVVLDNLGECKLAAAQQNETQEEHGD